MPRRTLATLLVPRATVSPAPLHHIELPCRCHSSTRLHTPGKATISRHHQARERLLRSPGVRLSSTIPPMQLASVWIRPHRTSTRCRKASGCITRRCGQREGSLYPRPRERQHDRPWLCAAGRDGGVSCWSLVGCWGSRPHHRYCGLRWVVRPYYVSSLPGEARGGVALCSWFGTAIFLVCMTRDMVQHRSCFTICDVEGSRAVYTVHRCRTNRCLDHAQTGRTPLVVTTQHRAVCGRAGGTCYVHARIQGVPNVFAKDSQVACGTSLLYFPGGR